MMRTHPVDPWRFTGTFLQRILSARIDAGPEHGPIPWAPVAKELARSRVALLSSAGLSMRGDVPFDVQGEPSADTHYATMGYQGGDTRVLEEESAPAIAESRRCERVDLAPLAPV
jgi:hypothetical protein